MTNDEKYTKSLIKTLQTELKIPAGRPQAKVPSLNTIT